MQSEEVPPRSGRDVDHIVETLVKRTQHVFANAQGSERHARLTQRLERLYGALELARVFEFGVLARRIERHIDAVRRDIEAD